MSAINALVLFVGTQAITFVHSKGQTPSTSSISHTAHMDIFQHMVVDFDTEGVCVCVCVCVCVHVCLCGLLHVPLYQYSTCRALFVLECYSKSVKVPK